MLSMLNYTQNYFSGWVGWLVVEVYAYINPSLAGVGAGTELGNSCEVVLVMYSQEIISMKLF